MKWLYNYGIWIAFPFLISCGTLAPFVMDTLTGSADKGGINTEIVVGDKEQVLGSNQDVKANAIGKVVGSSDNSVSAPSAKEVQVTNVNIPVWVFVLTMVLMVIGWVSPTPATMINNHLKRKG